MTPSPRTVSAEAAAIIAPTGPRVAWGFVAESMPWRTGPVVTSVQVTTASSYVSLNCTAFSPGLPVTDTATWNVSPTAGSWEGPATDTTIGSAARAAGGPVAMTAPSKASTKATAPILRFLKAFILSLLRVSIFPSLPHRDDGPVRQRKGFQDKVRDPCPLMKPQGDRLFSLRIGVHRCGQ